MPFNKPGELPKDRLTDYLDQPALIRPKEYRMMDTTLGATNALICEVLIPTPEKGSGRYFNLGDVPIFWKGVQAQLEGSAGEWVLGRLHQGTVSNPKQYVLLEATVEDEKLADAVIATHQEPF